MRGNKDEAMTYIRAEPLIVHVTTTFTFYPGFVKKSMLGIWEKLKISYSEAMAAGTIKGCILSSLTILRAYLISVIMSVDLKA